MKLRREATPPAPRCRSSWDPIAVILVLLLSAVAFGSLYEQRRLQARAEAAEAELEWMRVQVEVDRAMHEGEELRQQLEKLRGNPLGPRTVEMPQTAPPL